jgi:FkbM family methyltransferase
MSLKSKIKKLFNVILRKYGIEVISLRESVSRESVSMESALARSKRRQANIGTVIDIGASNGSWSIGLMKYYPDSSYFLIEAQKEHEDMLRKVKSEFKTLEYIIAAAGDTVGEIYFDAKDLFGGLASHSPFEKNCIVVPVVTIDHIVREKRLKPPFLLKLDTHGFEVPIFEGAKEILKYTELIVIETYNFNLTNESLRFHEMCTYLNELGFRCIDIANPLHRPKDGVLWQFDLFFAPSTIKEFNSNTYD